MLTYLKINNFTIIDKLETEFSSGFNALTGETGAGKSIIIKAMGLLMGNRASTDDIRKGSESAEIQAVFKLNNKTKEILKSMDIPFDDELIVRRVLSSKTSKNFVNGVIVSLNALKELMETVVSICGQNENQLINSPTEQLSLIDSLSSTEDLLKELKVIFKKLKELKTEEKNLLSEEDVKEHRISFLRSQIKTINSVPMDSEAELQEKELNLKKLSVVGDLVGLAESMESEDVSITVSLSSILEKINAVVKVDPSFSENQELIESAIEKVDQFYSNINAWKKNNTYDPDELKIIEDSLEKILNLKKKYGDIEGIKAKKKELVAELKSLENSDQRMKEIKEELKDFSKAYYKISKEISDKRKATALSLSSKVSQELQDLNMLGAQFVVEINKLPKITSSGEDEVLFKVSTNKGEPILPMNNIASGGELSRIMLSITKATNEKGSGLIYIFDEIDAGIGGETGLIIGKKIKEIAESNQTICITHLPQVAVFSNKHFVITKKEKDNRVFSDLIPIKSLEEREKELSRMLSGDMSKESIEHARALINKTNK